MVYEVREGREWSHIAMFDGQNWIPDFVKWICLVEGHIEEIPTIQYEDDNINLITRKL